MTRKKLAPYAPSAPSVKMIAAKRDFSQKTLIAYVEYLRRAAYECEQQRIGAVLEEEKSDYQLALFLFNKKIEVYQKEKNWQGKSVLLTQHIVERPEIKGAIEAIEQEWQQAKDKYAQYQNFPEKIIQEVRQGDGFFVLETVFPQAHKAAIDVISFLKKQIGSEVCISEHIYRPTGKRHFGIKVVFKNGDVAQNDLILKKLKPFNIFAEHIEKEIPDTFLCVQQSLELFSSYALPLYPKPAVKCDDNDIAAITPTINLAEEIQDFVLVGDSGSSSSSDGDLVKVIQHEDASEEDQESEEKTTSTCRLM